MWLANHSDQELAWAQTSVLGERRGWELEGLGFWVALEASAVRAHSGRGWQRAETVTEHRDSVGVQLSLMSHCLLYSGLRVSASLVLIHHI